MADIALFMNSLKDWRELHVNACLCSSSCNMRTTMRMRNVLRADWYEGCARCGGRLHGVCIDVACNGAQVSLCMRRHIQAATRLSFCWAARQLNKPSEPWLTGSCAHTSFTGSSQLYGRTYVHLLVGLSALGMHPYDLEISRKGRCAQRMLHVKDLGMKLLSEDTT